MEKMQSIVINPARVRWDPRLEEAPLPPHPRTRQGLVQVEQVGICRMDNLFLSHRTGSPPDPQRWVVGHEMVGRVTASGRETRRIRAGDWVVPVLRRSCRMCSSCLANAPDECTTNLYEEPGLHRAHGWASQWRVEQEEHLVVVSPAIADIALLTEPLALSTKGAQQLSVIQRRTIAYCRHFEHRWDQPHWAKDKHFVVAGASPLTVLTALYLRSLDATVSLYPTQPLPNDLAPAITTEKVNIVTPQGDSPPAEQVDRADGLIDTSGNSALVASLISAVYTNGVTVFLSPFAPAGGRGHDPALANMASEALRRNIVMLPCYRPGRPHLELAVQWLDDARKRRGFPFHLLLDQASPPDKFAHLAQTLPPWRKGLITWGTTLSGAPAL
ncbi:MAG: alcohol dehydrogenase catalytic domain-containing protein [Dehalococcoidia bacterium]